MKIEQIYTGCLAQGAYYIESDGEAAVIDPLREVDPYIEKAKRNNAKIKFVFETHFHADFVSGHLDLSKKTGAKIIFGPTAKPGFEAIIADDGDLFKIGKITIEVLHTPGHTMESSCFLLRNEGGKTVALFSGDTLFIGDVGRPDLAQNIIPELTQKKLAGYLFHSLRNKVLPLNDDVIVYPAHGAGSACGKNMSNETTDTLGHQKQSNYALRADMTEDEFITEVTRGLMPPPNYFSANVLMNINGYDSIDTVIDRGTKALSVNDFEIALEHNDALIIDTRAPQIFAKAFIPNSINIGIDGSFAPWAGALITDIKQKILIVAEKGREEEVVSRLARVGFDYCIGYLKGGIDAWKKHGNAIEHITSVSPTTLYETMLKHPVNILDVRKVSEFKSEHIIGAQNVPLDYINDTMQIIDKNKPYYVHCAAGYRSMIYISILKARGYNNLNDISGGIYEIKKTQKFKLKAYSIPETML